MRKRFSTVATASDRYTCAVGELAAGTRTVASELTVEVAREQWLKAKALRIKPTTADP